MIFQENEISKNANGGTELTKRSIEKLLDPELGSNFQVICSRIRDLDPTKIRVYWVHDLPGDPECDKIRDASFRAKFHLIAFTSEYQYLRFRQELKLPYSEKFVVIDSCVDPIDSGEKPTDTINLIYHSTPHRGLELLVHTFEHMAKMYPELRLHVFSSFKIYGWPEMDKQYEPLYKRIRDHDQMVYHEFASNDAVREQLKLSHIHAYPCIWEETFCRSVVEAMSAECICVHPNFGALPFTTGGLNFMYPGDADHNTHINTFANHLNVAIQVIKTDMQAAKDRLKFNKAFVDTQYSTQYIAHKWTVQMKKLLEQYPTEESRAFPEDEGSYFVINTGAT